MKIIESKLNGKKPKGRHQASHSEYLNQNSVWAPSFYAVNKRGVKWWTKKQQEKWSWWKIYCKFTAIDRTIIYSSTWSDKIEKRTFGEDTVEIVIDDFVKLKNQDIMTKVLPNSSEICMSEERVVLRIRKNFTKK